MNTSRTIKQGQYHPHPVTHVGPGVFETQSQDGTHAHTVRRRDDQFFCDCGCPFLCHHVVDVVTDSARRRGWRVVQVWTCEVDARRQHRRTVRYRAGRRPFWVTFAGKDPLAGIARFCQSWDLKAVDLFRRNGDGTDRHERREDLDFAALAERARAAGWTERRGYWYRSDLAE